MSGARVFELVRESRALAVLKISSDNREWQFYHHILPALAAFQMHVPRLIAAGRLEGTDWLLLEPIPRQEDDSGIDRPDPDLIAALARLHASTWDWRPEPTYFLARLSPAQRMIALEWLPSSRQIPLFHALNQLVGDHAWTFPARCGCHGDPSLSNWGRRAGTLVLYDWARFTVSDPAFDLAIALPWRRRHPDHIGWLAARYADAWLRETHRPYPYASSLDQDIARAKIFNVVEFLYLARNQLITAPASTMTRLTGEFVEWIDDIREWLVPAAQP